MQLFRSPPPLPAPHPSPPSRPHRNPRAPSPPHPRTRTQGPRTRAKRCPRSTRPRARTNLRCAHRTRLPTPSLGVLAGPVRGRLLSALGRAHASDPFLARLLVGGTRGAPSGPETPAVRLLHGRRPYFALVAVDPTHGYHDRRSRVTTPAPDRRLGQHRGALRELRSEGRCAPPTAYRSIVAASACSHPRAGSPLTAEATRG